MESKVTSSSSEDTSSSSEVHADAVAQDAKERGNEAYQKKDYVEAIRSFSEAITLQPGNHVLYSNRSAAYLAQGESKSKALHDAEKCVGSAPEWAKGYARLGASQHGLGRFADAQKSYLKAMDLDATGRSRYEAGLEAAKDGEKRATKRRIAEEQAREKLEDEMAKKRAAMAAAMREEERNDAELQNFFSALGDDQEKRDKEKKQQTNPVTEKYRTQHLGTAAENISRLTQRFSEFRNLNPFRVLKLDIDATIDDVKIRYRKLSALCHPDKNLDDTQNARHAFETIKNAYQILVDPKLRDRTILVVQGARDRAKANYSSQSSSQEEESFDDFQDREVMKTFAQNEMKRRDVEEHKRVHAAREQAHEAAAKKKIDDDQQFEDQWNDDGRRNSRIDFWQQFQDDDTRAKAQKRLRTAKNFKQQSQDTNKPKFGDVEIESWRKEWK